MKRMVLLLLAAVLLVACAKAPSEDTETATMQTIYETPVPTPVHPDYAPEVEEDPNVQYRESAGSISVDPAKHGTLRLWRSEEYLPYAGEGSMPVIVPYLVESEEPTGAVVIFPGGGYSMLSVESEGIGVAKYINETFGMSAFVVKYRVAPNNYRATLSDALRAIRFVRYYAETLNIRPDQIAVIGFSAGGHLAMMTAEHYDYGKTGDPIDAISSRPDAAFLCYPVGSMVSEYTHEESRANFLGDEDTEENRVRFSAEHGLREDMPPVYIIHNENDQTVPIESSYATVEAMEKAGLSVTYHWYDTGDHGYGINGYEKFGIDWTDRLQAWLSGLGFSTSKNDSAQ